MIITKTPYRVSFFGGGTDFPDWYNKNRGLVLSTTVKYYLYVSVKSLPLFVQEIKNKIFYSKVENVKNISDIKHRVFREYYNHIKLKSPLEVHLSSDLPAKSGMGSSSTFIVGLIGTIANHFGEKLSKKELYSKAIYFEQKILKESCGSQDQVIAASGGFNKIHFKKNNITVSEVKITEKRKKQLEDNLYLIFTNFSRKASSVEKDKIKKIDKNKKIYDKIYEITKKAIKIIENKNSNLDEFGRLLNVMWKIKKNTSSKVSNIKLDKIYNKGIKSGALGGKLLGAGNGGFLLFYVKKENKEFFIKSMNKYLYIPFKFSNEGFEVIYDAHSKKK